jgi:hypothetical protein
MIDLGSELKDWDDDQAGVRATNSGYGGEQPTHTTTAGMGSARLADLQAEGFNREPPGLTVLHTDTIVPGFTLDKLDVRLFDRLNDDGPQWIGDSNE